MKSTTQVYEQDKRVSNLLFATTKAAIERVHPETGGSLHLAHNWGNEAAKAAIEQHQNRQHIIYAVSQRLYKVAFKQEYPEHLSNK